MRNVLKQVEQLVREAGTAVDEIYRSAGDLNVEWKADNSPVTAADLAAHGILKAELPNILDLPLLSEESEPVPYAERKTWQRYWLVDPLDGTREFISGNGEFTVNVALIDGGRPVLGVVGVPTTGIVYTGLPGTGAFKDGVPIKVRSLTKDVDPVVVVSRRYHSVSIDNLVEHIHGRFGGAETRQAGSSLKFCLIAEGCADCYPRLAPTCEWDTAAAQAVLAAAGGKVFDLDGTVLSYNCKEELLNPSFLAVGDNDLPWLDFLIEC